jgi:hypothetical protein
MLSVGKHKETYQIESILRNVRARDYATTKALDGEGDDIA